MLCSCCSKCSPGEYFEKLRHLGQKYKNSNEFINLSNFSMGISSVERLILLKSLLETDRCVCELEVIIDKSQSTVSHHLRKLVTAGLVSDYKKGNYTYYYIEKERLKDYITRLESLLLF